MTPPNRTPDPDSTKRNALALAAHAVKKAQRAEIEKRATIRFAIEVGASLREVSEATGIPHVTVGRLAARATEE